jgi:hypothetical protein
MVLVILSIEASKVPGIAASSSTNWGIPTHRGKGTALWSLERIVVYWEVLMVAPWAKKMAAMGPVLLAGGARITSSQATAPSSNEARINETSITCIAQFVKKVVPLIVAALAAAVSLLVDFPEIEHEHEHERKPLPPPPPTSDEELGVW